MKARMFIALTLLLGTLSVAPLGPAGIPGFSPRCVDAAGAQPASAVPAWSRTYGKVYAWSVVATSDGGYAVAGGAYVDVSKDAWSYDFLLLKLDAGGNVQWQKQYGGPSIYDVDIAKSVVATPDGGYAVAGYTESFGAGNYDFWVLKLDAVGNAQWQKSYGGSDDDKANSLMATPDGGYAVAGYTDSFGAGGSDAWVLKLDASGNVQWERTYGGSSGDEANDLVATPNGGYAVAGYTSSFGTGNNDLWVLKLDASGNVQWEKTYGGSDDDSANSLVATPDGGYAVAGETSSFGAGGEDAWVLKLDANGEVIWQKTYGGSRNEVAMSIVATADGGYAAAGYTGFTYQVFDGFVLKLDTAGDLQWLKTYGSSGDDLAYDLVATNDGGYALAGTYQVSGTPTNVWVFKLDQDGAIGPNCFLIAVPNATVVTTTASPTVSAAVVSRSNAGATTSAAVVADRSATVQTQCLYQPPLHVASITPRYRPVGNRYRLGVEVAIVDETGQLVSGARVGLRVILPNGRQVRVAGQTGAEGHMSRVWSTSYSGTYTFTVTGAYKAGYTYDPSQNVETSDSVTVP